MPTPPAPPPIILFPSQLNLGCLSTRVVDDSRRGFKHGPLVPHFPLRGSPPKAGRQLGARLELLRSADREIEGEPTEHVRRVGFRHDGDLVAPVERGVEITAEAV